MSRQLDVLAQGQDHQRRPVERGLEGPGAQLGAEPFPRPPGLVAGVAEVPGDGMKGPVDRLGRLEVGDRDVQDDPPALGQLDGPTLRVGLVAVPQRPRPRTRRGPEAETGVDSHGGPAAVGDSQGGRSRLRGPTLRRCGLAIAPVGEHHGLRSRHPLPSREGRGARAALRLACAHGGPPHPPFGHLLPGGEKGMVDASAQRGRRGGAGKRSPSPSGRGERGGMRGSACAQRIREAI